MDTVDAQQYLLNYGIKPSVQRIAIMDFLLKNRIHPTVEEIYNALCGVVPTLSKTTVYNTLKLFAEHKALWALVIDEKNVRYDVDTSRHAHFQCLNCGKVYDLPMHPDSKLQRENGQGLIITEVHLYYKGYCKTCGETCKK